VKLLRLLGGGYAKVDDADFPRLSGYSWVLETPKKAEPVVVARVGGKKLPLRRLLAKAPAGSRVSHIDGDPLNLCRSNLVVQVKGSSIKHLKSTKHPRLGTVGVVWNEHEGVWQIIQTRFGHTTYRGRFYHRDEAMTELDKALVAHDLL